MNFTELNERLQVEGYDPHILERGHSILSLSDYRLEKIGNEWRVCWTERGEVVEVVLNTPIESLACSSYHQQVSGMMWHFQTSRERAPIDALEQLLRDAGVDVWRNDIPQFNGPNDPRYRVFVIGRDIQRAHQIAGV